MSEPGHLVPPAWIEAHGFTPESWRDYVAASNNEPSSRREALRIYRHTTQRFTRQQIWAIITVAFVVGLVAGLLA